MGRAHDSASHRPRVRAAQRGGGTARSGSWSGRARASLGVTTFRTAARSFQGPPRGGGARATVAPDRGEEGTSVGLVPSFSAASRARTSPQARRDFKQRATSSSSFQVPRWPSPPWKRAQGLSPEGAPPSCLGRPLEGAPGSQAQALPGGQSLRQRRPHHSGACQRLSHPSLSLSAFPACYRRSP